MKGGFIFKAGGDEKKKSGNKELDGAEEMTVYQKVRTKREIRRGRETEGRTGGTGGTRGRSELSSVSVGGGGGGKKINCAPPKKKRKKIIRGGLDRRAGRDSPGG